MDVIDVLSVMVCSLSVLVTLLIGWQIYQVISVNRIIKRKIEQKLQDYNCNVEKRLAAQQTELLTAIMTVQIDAGNVNMVLLMGAYIPKQMERASAITKENVIAEVEKIKSAIRCVDGCEYQFSKHCLHRLIEAYEPLSGFLEVRQFLSELRMLEENASLN